MRFYDRRKPNALHYDPEPAPISHFFLVNGRSRTHPSLRFAVEASMQVSIRIGKDNAGPHEQPVVSAEYTLLFRSQSGGGIHTDRPSHRDVAGNHRNQYQNRADRGRRQRIGSSLQTTGS